MSATTYNFRTFARQHDDIPAFHATFLVCTFLSAALLSVGYFGILILIHLCLDFVKYRDIHGSSLRLTFRGMFLESINDIALFLIALTFAVYLNHTYMLTALSGLLRSELTLLRTLGTLIPKARIMEHFLCIFLNMHTYLHSIPEGLHTSMSRVQRWSMHTAFVCLIMLIAAVPFFESREWDLIRVIRHELSLAI